MRVSFCLVGGFLYFSFKGDSLFSSLLFSFYRFFSEFKILLLPIKKL